MFKIKETAQKQSCQVPFKTNPMLKWFEIVFNIKLAIFMNAGFFLSS